MKDDISGDSPQMGESELTCELLDDIVAYAEEALGGAAVRSTVPPIERIKTLSKLLANKAGTIPYECSSLETCMKYDKAKRLGQLEDYRGAVRDVLYLALEAQLNACRLESAFAGRGRP